MAGSVSFVPTADDKLLSWSATFKSHIVANPTTYGLVALQSSSYATLHDSYAVALATVADKNTRNVSNVELKNVAKRNLTIQARGLGGMVQKNPAISDALKLGLGITVRSQGQPIPAPSSSPLIEIVGVAGNTVSLRFKSTETIGKRGKPAGVQGVQIHSLVGDAANTQDVSAWTFQGTTSQTLIDIELPESVAPGAMVWFTAAWVNPRLMTGPAADPVSTHTQFGSTKVMPVATRRKRAA